MKRKVRFDKVPESDIEKGPQKDEFQRNYNIFNKFRLLMWKNFTVQLRHKLRLLFQILLPVIFSLCLIIIRSLVVPIVYPYNTTYESFSPSNILPLRELENESGIKEWRLVYSPKNDLLTQFVTNVSNSLVLDEPEAVDTPEELETMMMERFLLCGVIFYNYTANDTRFQHVLNYTLRFPSESRFIRNDSSTYNWHTNLLYPLYSGGGPNSNDSNFGGPPFYMEDAFLAVQDRMNYFFVKVICEIEGCEEDANNLFMPQVYLQRFPYPSYTHDVLQDALEIWIGLFIMLSFIYTMTNVIEFIAVEQEKQLKDVMTIMGMPFSLHFFCWFCHTMILMIISITLIIALLKIPIYDGVAIFTQSDAIVIWIFLLVYSITIATYCFAMGVLFSNANKAGSVACLLWFMSYTPFLFLAINHVRLSQNAQIMLSLLPNFAMSYGLRIVMEAEEMGDGLQWNNLFDDTIDEGHLTVGLMIYLMIPMPIILTLITFYVEKLHPTKYGVPEKWNYIFSVKFWKELFGKVDDDDIDKDNNSETNSKEQDEKLKQPVDEKPKEVNKYFEPNLFDLVAGVKAENLRKEYNEEKIALNDLTIEIYCDQITTIVGHNGAGKTTFIKLLTGMTRPTSGTAIINGYNIKKNLKLARQSIGICPQHNILFDELTVREHIEFYCRLKGLKSSDVNKEVKKFIQLLDLRSKANSTSVSLSGGLQRKLSFAIAMCGGSKVILCDEPTTGMDPIARRELWKALLSEKFGRTIILTTHFMDEADILGDRIAIIADGQLKCYGTPFYLKKRLGGGYRLVCVKDEECESYKITALLSRYIPGIEMHMETPSEILYILPLEYMQKFPAILAKLENQLKSLKIVSFGVSSSELEEVFLKFVSKDDEEATTIEENDKYDEYELLKGKSLYLNQCYAMIKKRFYWWLSNWMLFAVLNVILIIFIVISFAFYHDAYLFYNLPKLNITFDSYGETETMLSRTENPSMQSIINEYRLMFDTYPDELLVEFDGNMDEHFLELGNAIRIRSNTRYLVGLGFQDNTVVAYFNNQLYHTAPLSLNLAYNAIIKARIGGCAGSITIENWPLAFGPEARVQLTYRYSGLGNQFATNITFAMGFIIAFHVIFYIQERVSKMKLLQFIAGINTIIFWIISFLFDIVVHLITVLVCYITVSSYSDEYWSMSEALSPLFFVLFLFGVSALAVTYLASFAFSRASYGFFGLTTLFLITGMCFYQIMRTFSDPILELFEVGDGLKWIFLFFPHYALSYCLFNLNQYQFQVIVTPNISLMDWAEPGIGRGLFYMGLVAIICIAILFLMEFKIFSLAIYYIRSRHKKKLPIIKKSAIINEDVQIEKDKVNKMTEDELTSTNLVVRNLTKFYGGLSAVKELCIAINVGEGFGLLGVNGAGKSSTFKMLTGDIPISKGEVFLNGFNINTHLKNVQKLTGYCPQFDAFFESLTGSQTLEIFALLRGCRRSDITGMIQQLGIDLNFERILELKISKYSGGNRRKLSTAIALIGNPHVIYLDEPSSGLDPTSKRNLWSVVLKARRSGTSVMLTSHSMEECEAICSRLAIMMSGELMCLGSAQYLKSKFPKGYLLAIKVSSKTGMTKLSPDTVLTQIKNFILKYFPGSYMRGSHQGMINFFIPVTKKLTVPSLFSTIEAAKEKYLFVDYSITQTTIEQVFLSLSGYKGKI